MNIHSVANIGKNIPMLLLPSSGSAVDLAKKMTSPVKSEDCLLSAILVELQNLPEAIGKSFASHMKRESLNEHNRAMNLEKQKQKTAAAELKVIEAKPPKITVIQSTNREIQRASDKGHVLRKF